MPANVDIATQEIVQMAEDADPQRRRTLGVLTKPDLVDKGAELRVCQSLRKTTAADKRQILDLVVENNHVTGLGYIIVCNRSQSELTATMEERNTREESLFNSAPWNKVPKERAGVGSLKKRLNELLVDITRRSFQSVSIEVDTRLKRASEELDLIGRPRCTPTEQRLYLLQVASSFQSLTTKATDAYYGRDQCFQNQESLRLATKIMAAHEGFSDLMYKHGTHRTFTIDADFEMGDEETDIEPTPHTDGSDSDHTTKRFRQLVVS